MDFEQNIEVDSIETKTNSLFDVQEIKKKRDEYYTLTLKVSHAIIGLIIILGLVGWTNSLFLKKSFEKVNNKLDIITDFVEEQKGVDEITEATEGFEEKHHLPAKYLGEFRLTFYTPKELGAESASSLKTATQTIPKEGRTIAVDPTIIPKGSLVYISGWGYYVAEDTGSAIKGKRIDIFMNNYQMAKTLGNKKVARVYLIK